MDTEQRKPYTYLVAFVLICIMTGLFVWNIFSGYFTHLDPLLSSIMAIGFAVAAVFELGNFFKALKDKKKEDQK